MSVFNAPTSYASPRATLERGSVITLGIGVILSLAIHLGIGVGASEYLAVAAMASGSDVNPIEIEDASSLPTPPRDEIQLGLEESSVASINWLGVAQNPEVGDVPVAEVEQAQFTTQVGDSSVSASLHKAVEPTPPAQQPIEQPVEQRAEQPAVIEPVIKEVIKEVAKEEAIEAAAKPVVQESKPTEQIELAPPENEDAQVLIEPQPDPVDESASESASESANEPTSEPVEPVDVKTPEDPAEQPTEQPAEELTEQPIEKPVEQPPKEPAKEPVEKPSEPSPQPQPQPQPAPSPNPTAASSPESAPQAVGKPGEVSEKESTASIIKRAIKVSASNLHKPIAGNGIEIITVDPKFPATVRFTLLPHNPVVMIRFDAAGKASKVWFLKEGKKVFNTGAKAIDEPLINAVYQWRAKGKEIKALNLDDPDSYIEISMRIIFRKESKSH